MDRLGIKGLETNDWNAFPFVMWGCWWYSNNERHNRSWCFTFATPCSLLRLAHPSLKNKRVVRRTFASCCLHTAQKSVEEARLAKFLAADWSNESQALENPPFWSHMRVSYRPLPFELLNGYSLYSESCYQTFLSRPYRTGVYRIVTRTDGKLELELYKIEGEEEFYQGILCCSVWKE